MSPSPNGGVCSKNSTGAPSRPARRVSRSAPGVEPAPGPEVAPLSARLQSPGLGASGWRRRETLPGSRLLRVRRTHPSISTPRTTGANLVTTPIWWSYSELPCGLSLDHPATLHALITESDRVCIGGAIINKIRKATLRNLLFFLIVVGLGWLGDLSDKSGQVKHKAPPRTGC